MFTGYPSPQRKKPRANARLSLDAVPKNSNSGGLLRCQRTQVIASFGGGTDDLHLLPIVRQILATIQAGDIGAGQSRCLTAGAGTDRDGKAIAIVPTAENVVQEFQNHTRLHSRL